ncbi:MAG: acetylxylan esterase [Bacteroidales bacterium]|nr:acetylxylan esterase [Bacteroidales bacterium]
MKRPAYLILLILFPLFLHSQNLLTAQWKFSTGDNPEWKKVAFDDSRWVDAVAGTPWENWGFANYDGFGWYRVKIEIPVSMKKEASRSGGLTLKLARIDDVDFTYFNGTLIGQNGDVPPAYECRYDADRKYLIPLKLIRWGELNTIAVRVYDDGGGGGIYGDEISLEIAGKSELFRITPVIADEDRVFTNIGQLDIPVELKNNNKSSIEGNFRIVVINDFSDTIAISTSAVTLQRKSSVIRNHTFIKPLPGIYRVTASFSSSGFSSQTKFNLAVEPEKMSSSATCPPDFQEFWDETKRQLSAIDPKYRLIKADSLSTGKRDCYIVEMQSFGNVKVRAYLLTPKKPGKYPAVLTVQGYSSVLQSNWTFPDDDVVSLGLNIRGHGNSRDDVNPGFPGYLIEGIEDKNDYIYRGAYMDCVRAVDFLFSRPEVDTTRVAVEGGSQGGALSFVTAALCGKRIIAAVPEVPFLSDFPDYMKVAQWPASEWNTYAEAHPEFGMQGILNTLSYFDISNLAPMITASVYMAVGLMDETCPPRINFAAYNKLKSEKKYTVHPTMGHGLTNEARELKYQFLREKLDIGNAPE